MSSVQIHFPTEETPLDRAIRAYIQVHTYILRLAKTNPHKHRTWNREYFHSLKSSAIATLTTTMQAAASHDELLVLYLERLYREYEPPPCSNTTSLQLPRRAYRKRDRIAAASPSTKALDTALSTTSQHQSIDPEEQLINPFQDCLCGGEIQWLSVFRPAREIMLAAKEICDRNEVIEV